MNYDISIIIAHYLPEFLSVNPLLKTLDIINKQIDISKKNYNERVIADYISGMTDRYALNIYKSIK